MTRHLYRFFPNLENQSLSVSGNSVAEVLQSVNKIAPNFTDYILDEHGSLRRHVNLSIDQATVVDRKTLSDRVPENATVFIFQALTGG